MVVTNLRSSGRPVSQMDFPTVTICGSGLHMGNVEEALRENIIKWRQERGKTKVDTIEEDVSEFMKDTYQIQSEEVNIFDIVNTMVAPNHAEATLAANGVRENFVACGTEFEDNDREENEDKSKREVRIETNDDESEDFLEIKDRIRYKIRQRKCIEPPLHSNTTNQEGIEDLPVVDVFLNPARKKELNHIVNTTIERTKDYFRTVDMRKVYPALLKLISSSTLPCSQLISACSTAGSPQNCSKMFARYQASDIYNSY